MINLERLRLLILKEQQLLLLKEQDYYYQNILNNCNINY